MGDRVTQELSLVGERRPPFLEFRVLGRPVYRPDDLQRLFYRHGLCNLLVSDNVLIGEIAMNPNVARRRREKASHSNQGSEQRSGDGRQHEGGQPQVNVGETERQLSMIGGTALAVYGMLRPSLSGLALAVIGGALIWRGHRGHCDMYEKLGFSSADSDSGSENAGGTESREARSKATSAADERAS